MAVASPAGVRVQRPPLSPRQRDWIERAWASLDVQRAIELDVKLVNIWSYTGHEREINEWAVDRWRTEGLEARYQPIDSEQGNALCRLGGTGDGPTLLLLCPIDTHWAGSVEQDGLQWGDPPRRDNMLPAQVQGQTVVGLGSNNAKACATAIMMAIDAIRRAGVELRGTLLAALAAGGAPASSPPGETRQAISGGAGVLHMLTHGVAPDFALYHKPGYHVAWEDMGLQQFRVRLHGQPQYLGLEEDGYRVSSDTARFVLAFNEWASEHRVTGRQGKFVPRAAANAVRLGRPDKPNWSPSISEVFVDIRSAPGQPAVETARLFERVMERILDANPGMRAEWEMVLSLPGGSTEPQTWIVQSAIRGAQLVDGDKSLDYEDCRPVTQSEAGLLYTWGIPTAKVFGGPGPTGRLPNPEHPADIDGFTMSCAYGPYIVKAAQVLSYAIVDTLTRSRDEVGIQN